jgi:hypothetical protein
MAGASVVVVVGRPGLLGVHRLLEVVGAALSLGVSPDRIVTAVNRAPRGARARAEITRALADLGGAGLASPMFLPERHRLDDLIADGHRLPAGLVGPVTAAVTSFLARLDVPARSVDPVPLR